MKKYIKYSGFLLVIAGIVLQVICYNMPTGNHNTLLLISFFSVMSGVVLYIYMMKKDSRY